MRVAAVDHIVCLVEEPSMEAALRLLLPTVARMPSFEIHSFQCKQELLCRLAQRLRGYAKWIPESWRIVVIVDRDDDDCLELKLRLERTAAEARLATRSSAGKRGYVLVNRIAIEELEAWFFGDWDAVRAAYPRVSSTIPSQARYRDPDAIAGGTWEALERLLQKAGYFRTGLAKIAVARAVGRYMIPSRNRSHSFQVLHRALLDITSAK